MNTRAVGLSFVLRIVALVVFIIATLIGFGVFNGSHEEGWIALGLTFWVFSTLVP